MSISIDADKKNQRNEIKSLNKVRGREEATLHKVMRKSFSEEMTFKLVLKQPESLVGQHLGLSVFCSLCNSNT